MSATPRTDAEATANWSEGNKGFGSNYADLVVPAEFACQLERELAEARKEIAMLVKCQIDNCASVTQLAHELVEARDHDHLSICGVLESMARLHCYTSKVEREHHGQVVGSLATDSGGISTHADALETLCAENPSRFRIVAQSNRIVVGYWPENDPTKPAFEDPA